MRNHHGQRSSEIFIKDFYRMKFFKILIDAKFCYLIFVLINITRTITGELDFYINSLLDLYKPIIILLIQQGIYKIVFDCMLVSIT